MDFGPPDKIDTYVSENRLDNLDDITNLHAGEALNAE